MRVLTLGTYDTLHLGHLGLFKQCRRIAGPDPYVIVAVNTDAFVEKYKNHPPLMPYSVRAGVIAELRTVDQVVMNCGDWMQGPLIRDLRPDILVVGDDWAKKNYLEQIKVTQGQLDDWDIQLCYVPRTGDWSSTAIKESRPFG
jgi:glycerol-3-phosphate cytidylyltransferase